LHHHSKLKQQTMTTTTYFWNHEYRHQMRDLKPSIQKRIKRAFERFDLQLDGVSDLHLELIQEYTGEYLIEGETIQDMEARMKANYIF
jgi:hypothetical protein